MGGLINMRPDGNGYIGIAPQAAVFSLKITSSSWTTDVWCGSSEQPPTCGTEAAVVHALDYARTHGVKVMSVSLLGNWGGSVYSATYNLYAQGDALILAATGNVGDVGTGMAGWSFVMGVGAVDEAGFSHDRGDAGEEVSGFGGGETLWAVCPGPGDTGERCDYMQADPTFHYGCPSNINHCYTSPATANVAAIAALVRGANPSFSAFMTREALKNTAEGTTKVVDALAAVTYTSGPPKPTASIEGPTTVQPYSLCTWEGNATGGTATYSYAWSGVMSGSGAFLTSSITSSGMLTLIVTDAMAQKDTAQAWITADWGASPCNPF